VLSVVNVTVTTAGTSGPRGFSWLSGAGAPASNLVGSLDGDFYLDTTNVGFYYGPRAAGLWGTPHAFGNSLNGVPLTNVTATVAPTVSNDGTQGYAKGSLWINNTSGGVFIAVGVATGAAIWISLQNTGYRTITGSSALTVYDRTVYVNAASAPVTVTLPSAVGVLNRYDIKKIDSSTNVVTVAAQSGETIDGAPTSTLVNQYVSITVASSGGVTGAWYVV
jgi:hypothetical protein